MNFRNLKNYLRHTTVNNWSLSEAKPQQQRAVFIKDYNTCLCRSVKDGLYKYDNILCVFGDCYLGCTYEPGVSSGKKLIIINSRLFLCRRRGLKALYNV